MGWDQTWRLKRRSLKVAALREEGERVAEAYRGVRCTAEADGGDLLCLFAVPRDEEGAAVDTVEVSIYDMGGGRFVISLEADVADNDAIWDDACELAEALAERLGAAPLEL